MIWNTLRTGYIIFFRQSCNSYFSLHHSNFCSQLIKRKYTTLQKVILQVLRTKHFIPRARRYNLSPPAAYRLRLPTQFNANPRFCRFHSIDSLDPNSQICLLQVRSLRCLNSALCFSSVTLDTVIWTLSGNFISVVFDSLMFRSGHFYTTIAENCSKRF